MLDFYGMPKIIRETPEQQAEREEQEALAEIQRVEEKRKQKNQKIEKADKDYGYLLEAISTTMSIVPELRYLFYQLVRRQRVEDFNHTVSLYYILLLVRLFEKEIQGDFKYLAESERSEVSVIKYDLKKIQVEIARFLYAAELPSDASKEEKQWECIKIFMFANPGFSHAKIAKHYKLKEEQIATFIANNKALADYRDKYRIFEMDIMAITIQEYIVHHPEEALSAVYKAVCGKNMSMDQFLYVLKTYHITISNPEPETRKELASRVQRLIDENPTMAPSKLAKELGWTRSQVEHFIKKNHLRYKAKRRKKTYLDFNQVKEYATQHPESTYTELAKNFGVSTNSIVHFMYKYGIMKGGSIVSKAVAKHPSGRAIVVQKDVSGEAYTYETIYGTGKETTLQKAKDAARLTSFTEAERQQGIDKGSWKWRNFD
ncbi:hypothetical protein HB847_15050 [Listeria booriae]|uniref:Uncharacterized protein n=1 Tax=Listeria booriae TaxID=1552123 RepID=A0A841Y9U3_9LIST|nr:hypothetical protein [Listeria booriae]MBC1373669.1 hypothetical protein [Listeria booriae]